MVHLGCAKNLYDAEIMSGALLTHGWREAPEARDASVILINSCGFIEPAQAETIETAFEYISAYPDKQVVMTGCLSQRYPEEIAREMPELAGVFGNRRPESIVEFLRGLGAGSVGETPGRRRESESAPWLTPTADPDWYARIATRPRLYSPRGTAYVKIAEGCTHNCAFCAIPRIRGTLRSRPVEAILGEVRELLSRGIREINLIAQDLTLLGVDRGRRDFVPLLREIAALPGEFWVRLLYIYPEHFPSEVIEVCRQDRRILPYFDLPVQHASPTILKSMGRAATPERTLDTVRMIKRELPEAAIRTTFLVGFPGEGEGEFRELLHFQEEARFDWMGAFVYSPQEGTRGFELSRGKSAVPEERAQERARILYEAQEPITAERLSRFVGTQQRLIVEEAVSGEDIYFARGPMQAPQVDGTVVLFAPEGSLEPGAFRETKVIGVDGYDLRARLLTEGA
ncbi:MAG: 30S ribosomal protein S12 methylthiotransferase RimO [Spirochaetaceae bacterium]